MVLCRTPAVGAVVKFGRGITGLMGVDVTQDFIEKDGTLGCCSEVCQGVRKVEQFHALEIATKQIRRSLSRFPFLLGRMFSTIPTRNTTGTPDPSLYVRSSAAHHPGYRSLPLLETFRCIQ